LANRQPRATAVHSSSSGLNPPGTSSSWMWRPGRS